MTTPDAAARLGFPIDPVPQTETAVNEMVRSYVWRLTFYQFCDAHPHHCPLDSDMTDSEEQWLEERREKLLRERGRTVAAYLRAIPRPRWDEMDPISQDLYDHYQRCVASLLID